MSHDIELVTNLAIAGGLLFLVVWAITRMAYSTVRTQRKRDAWREYQQWVSRQPPLPPPPPSDRVG